MAKTDSKSIFLIAKNVPFSMEIVHFHHKKQNLTPSAETRPTNSSVANSLAGNVPAMRKNGTDRLGAGVACGSGRLRLAVPPEAAAPAQRAIELGLQHPVQHHARQRVAALAGDQVGARGARPYLEQLL